MKSKKSLFFTVLACFVLTWGETPSQAQTSNYEGYDIPTNYTNPDAGVTNDFYIGFVWVGTNGTFSDQGNFDVYLPASLNWIDPGVQGFINKDFGESILDQWGTFPDQGGDILFSNTSGSTETITLSANAMGSGVQAGSNLIVGSGFKFDLNGFKLQGTNGANSIYYNLVLGDGPGAANVSFVDSTGNPNTATFSGLTLGANGSSNNIWGGANATVTFGANVTPVLKGNITVGDGASTGNIFNGTAGQTLGSVTVNAGTGNEANLNNETAGSVIINGGSANLNGATLTGGIIYNGGALTINNGITINSAAQQALNLGAGLNLNISGGSITSTANNGVTTGAGSNLVIDNTTVSVTSVSLAGTTTIQDGGKISTGHAGDNISGNLIITGANSSYAGGTVGSGTTGGVTLSSGAQISVTDGGNFSTVGLQSADIINLNVDSSSTFSVSGNLAGTSGGAISGLNITGGGTVFAGTFSAGVTNVGDVLVNTGTGKLSVAKLTLGNGPSIGTRGNVEVTSALVMGKTSTMASGDVLELNGDVALSASSAFKGLEVNAGAVISGQGRVSQAATNGSEIDLNGGMLRVGDTNAITGQTLTFNTGSFRAGNIFTASTFEFSLYADGTNDQLQVDSSVQFVNLNLKLDLVGDMATIKSNFDAGLTTFDLFTDLSGNGLNTIGTGSVTLDSNTITLFASEGYSVDTSMLGTNGTITLDAMSVPEPSTWALLFAGAGLLVFFQRRRAASGSISTNV